MVLTVLWDTNPFGNLLTFLDLLPTPVLINPRFCIHFLEVYQHPLCLPDYPHKTLGISCKAVESYLNLIPSPPSIASWRWESLLNANNITFFCLQYCYLTWVGGLNNIMYANMLSSVPAVQWVIFTGKFNVMGNTTCWLVEQQIWVILVECLLETSEDDLKISWESTRSEQWKLMGHW